MKCLFFILTTSLSLGWTAVANAQSTQFIFGIPSNRIGLSITAYEPIYLIDSHGYPNQGFYHYYSLPILEGKTNYNPVSYSIPSNKQPIAGFEFPEEGNFVF